MVVESREQQQENLRGHNEDDDDDAVPVQRAGVVRRMGRPVLLATLPFANLERYFCKLRLGVTHHIPGMLFASAMCTYALSIGAIWFRDRVQFLYIAFLTLQFCCALMMFFCTTTLLIMMHQLRHTALIFPFASRLFTTPYCYLTLFSSMCLVFFAFADIVASLHHCHLLELVCFVFQMFFQAVMLGLQYGKKNYWNKLLEPPREGGELTRVRFCARIEHFLLYGPAAQHE